MPDIDLTDNDLTAKDIALVLTMLELLKRPSVPLTVVKTYWRNVEIVRTYRPDPPEIPRD
jgi:hypothetical protein